MSRPISVAGRRSMFAAETEAIWIALVTVAHPALDPPFRVASAGIVKSGDHWIVPSRGNDFVWFPFDVTLPGERDDDDGQTRIVIDNVDRDIVAALRASTDRADVTLEVVLHSDPDLVEAGPYDCKLAEADWDSLTIEGTLDFDPRGHDAWPCITFDPPGFPDLFDA